MSVARDGLASLYGRMRVVRHGEPETGLGTLLSAPARHELTAVEVTGGGTAERELAVPYRGERLSGDALLRQLDAWVAAGIIESSCADAVRTVAASPDWLALPGRTVVVLGAGAEVGPLPVLLSWGARVIGIDLPRPAIWDRVLETAKRSGGTLLVPVADAKPGQAGVDSSEDLAQRAGFDLAGDIPAVADWLAGLDGPLVLGNYVYADGAANVRVASAVDALTVRLLAERARRGARVPGHAHRRVRRAARRGRPVGPRLRGQASGEQARPRAAAVAVRRPAAPPGLSARIRSRHLRQPGRPAGAELRAGQAPAAVARHGRPRRWRGRVDERRPAHPYQVGYQEPGAGRRVRGRRAVRRRGVRARHDQGAHGGPARPRPARRAAGGRASLAGRGLRGRARRPVADGLRSPQRAHAGRAARLRRRQEIVTRSGAAGCPGAPRGPRRPAPRPGRRPGQRDGGPRCAGPAGRPGSTRSARSPAACRSGPGPAPG